MKVAIQKRSITQNRPIKPKLLSKMQIFKIESISLSSDYKGNTYLTIYPCLMTIASKSIIQMIELKSNHIILQDGICVLREDILSALNRYLSLSQSVAFDGKDVSTATYERKGEPKRPSNAYILYNNDLRKKIKALFPEYSQSETSKLVAATWKAVTKEVKEEYIKKAIECRRLHKKRYPNFEYNIKKSSTSRNLPSAESIKNDNWDEYFDWCIENVTTQSASGLIYADKSNSSENTIEPSFLFQENSCSYQGLDFSLEKEHQYDWNDVYDIVTQFLPEEADNTASIDEHLWQSLDSTEILNDCNTSFIDFFNNLNS